MQESSIFAICKQITMAVSKICFKTNISTWFWKELKVLLMFLLLIVNVPNLFSQFYNGSNISFGKNRVQWQNRIWSYYSYDEFETYFFQGGKELALYTAEYAKQEIEILERQLQSSLTEKIQFIIFNNLSELKHSNIGLSSESEYNTGGITNIMGSKVILYFDGNYVNFEQLIRNGIAEILLNQVLFGGSVGSQISNSTISSIPTWFKEGILSYYSQEWNTQFDGILRNGIISGRYKKMNQLTGNDAVVAGHSFWMFIEETYGKDAVAEIIQTTRMSKSVKKAVKLVTGLKFKKLINQWFTYCQSKFVDINQNFPSNIIPLKYRSYRSFEQPKISPNGRYLAYVSNDEGKIRFWLEDLTTKQKRKLFKTGFRSDDYIDPSYPILAWHPNSEILAFVIEKKGNIILNFLHLNDFSIEDRNMIDFQKITSMSYSSDGKKIAISAVKNGKPDIYIFDIPANSHKQITDDYFTDLNPVFVQNGKKIVFSSNRTSDTLKKHDKPVFQKNQFNLYAYDVAEKSIILRKVTDETIFNSFKPEPIDKDKMLFLNDSDGYFNLYEARFDSAISFVDTAVHYRYYSNIKKLTAFTSNILDYSYDVEQQMLTLLMNTDGTQKIFKESVSEKRIPRNEIELTLFARQKIENAHKQSIDDTTRKVSRRHFKMLYKPVIQEDTTTLEPLPSRQGAFGIFGGKKTDLRRYRGHSNNINDTIPVAPKMYNYYVEYFYDELFTQVDFSYINYSYQTFSGGSSPIYLNPGFNVFLGVNMSDLLEDHHLSGGVRLNTNLTNNEYALTYKDLSKRIDKQIVLHRQVDDDYSYAYYSKVFSHEAFYMLSLPFNEVLSLRGTAIYRNDCRVYLASDQTNLEQPNEFRHWIGLRGEFVYDNSRQIGTNLHVGSRGKVFGECFQLINSNTSNFVVLGFDYRNYQRIHRNFIWANRIAGSTSFGSDRLIYYMGGVDNWIGASFDQQTPIDYSQNFIYQTLATSLRGFKQNIRNGSNFVVINSELRFPVFSYLFQTPISMDFINDFQLVAFGDVGTAWVGTSPYASSNSLYTSYIQNGPLNISVEIQKNPIVGGFGFGARTTLLGYFVRADVAWGVEDAKIKDPMFYISFSLDF